jgi:hypothetical protein
MTRGRFQNDAAVTFAVMSHKTILSFLVHFPPIFPVATKCSTPARVRVISKTALIWDYLKPISRHAIVFFTVFIDSRFEQSSARFTLWQFLHVFELSPIARDLTFT